MKKNVIGANNPSGEKKHLDYFESLAPERAVYRKRFRYYYDDIARYCGYFIYSESSVLEVGCGTGELLNDVPGRRKVGIDFSPRMVKEARRQFPSLEFHVMDAESMELNEVFDFTFKFPTGTKDVRIRMIYAGAAEPAVWIFVTPL